MRSLPASLAAAALAAAALSPGTPAAGGELPWVEDDHARALAEARARKVPIVADVWTPW
ncbi:MAG TPA: hypothetical protein VH880_05635 [Anaeromyxobacteraceae bacterium]|jgi:hypothetical protein